jgi:hypothetical protein
MQSRLARESECARNHSKNSSYKFLERALRIHPFSRKAPDGGFRHSRPDGIRAGSEERVTGRAVPPRSGSLDTFGSGRHLGLIGGRVAP